MAVAGYRGGGNSGPREGESGAAEPTSGAPKSPSATARGIVHLALPEPGVVLDPGETPTIACSAGASYWAGDITKVTCEECWLAYLRTRIHEDE